MLKWLKMAWHEYQRRNRETEAKLRIVYELEGCPAHPGGYEGWKRDALKSAADRKQLRGGW